MITMAERISEVIALALDDLQNGRINPHEVAFAIITVMREPTDAMLDHGEFPNDMSRAAAASIWPAIIDCALGEKIPPL